MNDNQAIINKIISDAEDFASSAAAAAEAQAQAAIAEARAKAEETENAERENAAKEGEEFVARRMTIARLDGKKAMLGAKQQIVSEVFEKALEKLCAAPEDKYFALVKKGVEKYAESGDTVILSENAPFSAEKLQSAVSGLGITVLKQGKFKGGAIVSGAKRDTDLSFEALVADYYEKSSGDVARAIFGDE